MAVKVLGTNAPDAYGDVIADFTRKENWPLALVAPLLGVMVSAAPRDEDSEMARFARKFPQLSLSVTRTSDVWVPSACTWAGEAVTQESAALTMLGLHASTVVVSVVVLFPVLESLVVEATLA